VKTAARPARTKQQVNDLIRRGNRLVPSKEQRAADEDARRLIAAYKTHPRQK